MKYLSHLPQEKRLITLAYRAHFPIGRDQLIQLALHEHAGQSTIRFLRLFEPTDTFENGVDLVNRCEEMKLFIHDARLSQPEVAHSAEC